MYSTRLTCFDQVWAFTGVAGVQGEGASYVSHPKPRAGGIKVPSCVSGGGFIATAD